MNTETFAEYADQYRKMHEKGAFSGGSLKFEYADSIRAIVDRTGSKTVLDFGCGKAIHYKKENPINERFNIESKNISFYDPGVPEYSVLPAGKFDGVICTDVLEHIPEGLLPETLETIFTKAEKFVFLVIDCGLAVKKLPNGENAHATVKLPAWWNTQLRPYYDVERIIHVRYTWPDDPALNILKL